MNAAAPRLHRTSKFLNSGRRFRSADRATHFEDKNTPKDPSSKIVEPTPSTATSGNRSARGWGTRLGSLFSGDEGESRTCYSLLRACTCCVVVRRVSLTNSNEREPSRLTAKNPPLRITKPEIVTGYMRGDGDVSLVPRFVVFIQIVK